MEQEGEENVILTRCMYVGCAWNQPEISLDSQRVENRFDQTSKRKLCNELKSELTFANSSEEVRFTLCHAL